jgi:hypothetical protein
MKSPHCSGVAGHLLTYSSSSPRLSLTFAALTTLSRADCQFGWLQGIAKQLNGKYFWLRGLHSNQGYLKPHRAPAHQAGVLLNYEHLLC